MIVVPYPSGGEVSDLIEFCPVVLAEPLVTYCSVKLFNVGVLLRLARLDILEGNTSLACPGLDCGTDIFRAVIAPNNVGPAAPLNDLF